jgi:mannonate dehydratase
LITFRWFGSRDPIPLDYIRQIPVVRGIVSALFDIPVGRVWQLDRIVALRTEVERHGMSLSVIESIPVHEDIKLGLPTRDRLVDNYCESVRNMGRAGVPVLCYNFMPVFDWTRTELARPLEDGSTVLAYDDGALGPPIFPAGPRRIPRTS